MKEAFDKKEDERLKKIVVKAFLPTLVNNLHHDGIINDDDLSNKSSLFTKIQKYLEKTKDTLFSIVIDHRSTILSLADQQNKEGNSELAISLYATFIEHTLNNIINIECNKKKLDEKTKVDIIRSVNLSGKCSWLLKILGLPAFKADHVKTILAIADERNSYFHYKWKPEPDTDKIPDLDKKKKLHEEKIKKIKSLIKYLRTYETKHQFRGNKRKILKVSF